MFDEKNINPHIPIIEPLTIYNVGGFIALRLVNNILDGIADKPNKNDAITALINIFLLMTNFLEKSYENTIIKAMIPNAKSN